MHAHKKLNRATHDQDRDDPEHDLICSYLSQPSVIEQIVKMVPPPNCHATEHDCNVAVPHYHHSEIVHFDHTHFKGQRIVHNTPHHVHTVEHPLMVGGKVSAFIDMLIKASYPATYRGIVDHFQADTDLSQCNDGNIQYYIYHNISKNRVLGRLQHRDGHRWRTDCTYQNITLDYTADEIVPIIVEAKTQEVTTGEIIRQVKMYKQYLKNQIYHSRIECVVATRWKPSEKMVELLEHESIKHMHVAEDFDKWKATL